MSTTPSALYPNYYQPYYQQAGAGNVGYTATTNPVGAAANNKSVVESQGNQYQLSDEELAQQQQQQQAGTQGYLNPIEQTNASGGGGYTPGEASQIEMTPGQEQSIVTNAGISAGTGTAAAVGGAERSAAAAGGSPAAMATYRARAAQSQAANAGNASTGAAVAAQQAGSAGAQAVGGEQIAQENQGLSYLGNLQAQQGQAGQSEQGLAQGAYGTETSGTTAATGQQIQASQLPTGIDKGIGIAAGAASALADGDPGYLENNGQDAVVGENGLEAVIENAPKAVLAGASDPVRSDTTFMDAGTQGGDPSGGSDASATWGMTPVAGPSNGDYGGETNTPATPVTPAGASVAAAKQNWLQRYLASNKNVMPAPTMAGQPAWNPTTPYQQIGSALGNVARYIAPHLAEGHMGGGFHWSNPVTPKPSTPRQLERANYQPLAYRAKPVLADGAAPIAPAIAPAESDDPVSPAMQNGMQVGNAKVFDKPTAVHLDQGDSVVPLSYRPKAKVRPSAALPALKAHHHYGERHAA